MNNSNDQDNSKKFLIKKPDFFNRNKNHNKKNQNNPNNQKNDPVKKPQANGPAAVSAIKPAPSNPVSPVSNANKNAKEIKNNQNNQNFQNSKPNQMPQMQKKDNNNNNNNNRRYDHQFANKKSGSRNNNHHNRNNINIPAVKNAAETNTNAHTNENKYNNHIAKEPETEIFSTEYQHQPDDEITASPSFNLTNLTEIDDKSEKIEIVGIRFKPVGKVYFFSPNSVEYSANEKIIVETSRGFELGYVVIPNKNISINKVVQPLKPVLRKATEDDIQRSEKNKITAKETIKIANDRIKFHNLNNMKMKLIEAEYTFDNSKLIYYFTADGRVDFRELVKDLAAIFKTRIEMRQIGIRDQTKILGGLSICGRPFCCNSFLQDLAQVTIKMAKEQNMSINSAKISGACGKLMCCLKYEHEAYDYLSKDTPKVNSIVEISTGETGVVTDSNLLTGICKVRINPKPGVENEAAIKPFPKKNLKVIGFMKNEQEHIKNKAGEEIAEDPEVLKKLESDL